MFLRAEEGMRRKTEKRLGRGSRAWGKRDGDLRYGGSVRVGKQAIDGRRWSWEPGRRRTADSRPGCFVEGLISRRWNVYVRVQE